MGEHSAQKKSAQSYVRKGIAFRKAYKSDQALSSFANAVKTDPNHLGALANLVVEYLLRGTTESAYHLSKSLELRFSDSILPKILLAEVYLQLDQFEKAEDYMSEFAAYDDSPNHYLLRKAKSLKLQDFITESMSALDKVETQDMLTQQMSNWLFLKADCCQKLGEYKSAIELLEQFVHAHPAEYELKSKLAEQYLLSKDQIKAKQLYLEVLEESPKHGKAIMGIIETYSELNESQKIQDLISNYLDEEANQALSVLIFISNFYLSTSQYSKAEKLFDSLIIKFPQCPKGYIGKSKVLNLKGRYDEGLDILEEAEGECIDSKTVQLAKAEYYRLIGEFQNANKIFQRISRDYPKDIKLNSSVAKYLSVSGYYQESNDKLADYHPQSAKLLMSKHALLAKNYFRLYDYQSAIENYKKAIVIDPLNNNLRENLTLTYIVVGDLNKAAEELQAATKIEETRKSQSNYLPLRGHAAMILNDISADSQTKQDLMSSSDQENSQRVNSYKSILRANPKSLGAGIFLSRSLRSNGLFDKLNNHLMTEADSHIPKTIVQYWHSSALPDDLKLNCDKWQTMNPDYNYVRFNSKSAANFLNQNYDDKIRKAWENCDNAAIQSDFLRLAYLNLKGGVYVDIDDCCLQPLFTLIKGDAELMVAQEDIAVIGNNFIAAIPNCKSVKSAFDQVTEYLLHYNKESAWFKSGPAPLTTAIMHQLSLVDDNAALSQWPKIRILSQSEIRKHIYQHMPFAYKSTDKHWYHSAYSMS